MDHLKIPFATRQEKSCNPTNDQLLVSGARILSLKFGVFAGSGAAAGCIGHGWSALCGAGAMTESLAHGAGFANGHAAAFHLIAAEMRHLLDSGAVQTVIASTRV